MTTYYRMTALERMTSYSSNALFWNMGKVQMPSDAPSDAMRLLLSLCVPPWVSRSSALSEIIRLRVWTVPYHLQRSHCHLAYYHHHLKRYHCHLACYHYHRKRYHCHFSSYTVTDRVDHKPPILTQNVPGID